MTIPVLPLSTHPSPSELCSCWWVLPHRRRGSSLLNVDFSIMMMTESGCHSQPRKHTTTLANKYRSWWKHYLHTGKTKACKQRKRCSIYIKFLHKRPNHLRLYHGTSGLNVALVKDEVGLPLFLWQAGRVLLREDCQPTLLLEELWSGATHAVSCSSQKQLGTWSSKYPNLVSKIGSIYSHKYSTVPPSFRWWMYF